MGRSGEDLEPGKVRRSGEDLEAMKLSWKNVSRKM